MKISEQDKERISQVVKQAESNTSGEIVPLIVHASDAYPHADLAGGIIGQALLLLAGVWLLPDLDLAYLLTTQVVGFIAGFILTRRVPWIKRFILGRRTVETEVYQRAVQAFLEHGLTRTRDRTGILIMTSLLERRVQVLADEGINKKVPEGTWDGVVSLVLDGIRSGSLIDGLCAAVLRCGEILSEEFPIKDDDVDELADKLIVE